MRKIVVGVCLGLLSACSAQYTTNGEQNYLSSRNGSGVIVPPPLTSSNISHFYDLPSQDQHATVSIVPPVLKGSESS